MTYAEEDTIAAVSTAVSPSGIGIIRISGPEALQAADLVFRPAGGRTKLSEAPTHTIHYGFVRNAEGDVIDEVLASVMRAPRTYTAEDTVEISCHGGVLVMQKVLETVLAAAASGIRIRAAEPGEFTRRAYLNGRIDLSRAEAVMDVIGAKNEYALKNAVSQVRGSLYRRITALREEILYEVAHIEASLDDPEHLDYSGHTDELMQKIREWTGALQDLIRTADDGRLACEGIRTVIVGKPNAGKSSLLNLLVGEERAIVTDIAGTTRDVLTETINLQGITLLVADTAGIRHTDDRVEQIGVEKARQSAMDADLLLWIADSSTPLDENDSEICRMLQGRNSVILLNKTDLEPVTDEAGIRALLSSCGAFTPEQAGQLPIIPFSAKQRIGYEDLVLVLKDMFFSGRMYWNDEVVITNARHKALLQKALDSLVRAGDSIRAGMSEDFFPVDLMDAYGSLGGIIGQETGDDLADEIFSRFCMGK